MRYTEFSKAIKETGIVEDIRSYRRHLQLNNEGKVLIDGSVTDFKSLEEARQYVKQEYIS